MAASCRSELLLLSGGRGSKPQPPPLARLASQASRAAPALAAHCLQHGWQRVAAEKETGFLSLAAVAKHLRTKAASGGGGPAWHGCWRGRRGGGDEEGGGGLTVPCGGGEAPPRGGGLGGTMWCGCWRGRGGGADKEGVRQRGRLGGTEKYFFFSRGTKQPSKRINDGFCMVLTLEYAFYPVLQFRNEY